MRVAILTLFPELFGPLLETSMIGRARKAELVRVSLHDLRPFGLGRHRQVDDTPYGGGSGMVMRVEPIVAALEAIDDELRAEGCEPAHRVLMTPQGAPFTQAKATHLASTSSFALVCGRYEGFDERIRAFVHEEISLGDFVLMGGEVAAMAILEASARLLPGVLGNDESTVLESHSEAARGGLEYPQYTRPASFRGLDVPEVLSSGNHAVIDAWRRAESEKRTTARRPDLVRAPTIDADAGRKRGRDR